MTSPCVPFNYSANADEAVTIAQCLLQCVSSAVDNAGSLTINRVCLVPGDIVWDNCDCGQLAISETRRFGGRDFNVEEETNEGDCAEPWLTVDLALSLMRCAPVGDDAGNPPDCTLLTAAATQLMKDKRDIRRAVMCCLTAIFNQEPTPLRAFSLGSQDTAGPQGACVGSTMQILLGFLNPCEC